MIDTELATFLEEGIYIQLGTRNAQLEPNGCRVIAARVDDEQHLVAYLHEAAGRQVLPDLESNGQAALAFARPPDERACQLKGTVTDTRPATDAERAFVDAQWNRWLERLTTIGVARETFGSWPTWPCLAIRVRVTAIFNQTPGPGTGGQIK